MEQHIHETSHKENKPGYIPVIIIVAVLSILATTLLQHYSKGNSSGYLWQAYEKANPEAGEGAEHHSGHEEHGGPESLQEPEHGGETMHGNATEGKLDTVTGQYLHDTVGVKTDHAIMHADSVK